MENIEEDEDINIYRAQGRKALMNYKANIKTMLADAESTQITKHLPQKFCEDFTLEDLSRKIGRAKLSAKNRYKICGELGLPTWDPTVEDSYGYPRGTILNLAGKISNKSSKLDDDDRRILNQWRGNYRAADAKLDEYVAKFILDEHMTEKELEELDKLLLSRYCKCVSKRNQKTAKLFATGNVEEIVKDNNEAQLMVTKYLNKNYQVWALYALEESKQNEAREKLLSEVLLPYFLDLDVKGCKISIYQRGRHIKPANRKCDTDLYNAEALLDRGIAVDETANIEHQIEKLPNSQPLPSIRTRTRTRTSTRTRSSASRSKSQ